MSRRLLNRTARAAFTIFAVVSLTFGIVRLLPGGPMDYMRAKLRQESSNLSGAEIDRLVASYTNVRPDEPLYVQYVDYLVAVSQGNLGQSTYYQRPVAEILVDAAPWTIFLMTLSMAIMFVVGVALGALMAYLEGSRFDVATTGVSIVLNSVPYYVAAVLFQYVLAYQLGWFPATGRVAPGVSAEAKLPFFVSALNHAGLPILSMVLTGFGGWALIMRGNSISVLGKDYLKVARLRGLSRTRIAFRYVGRNAILPMYTSILITIGFMFGGSIVLEEIFAYTGLGYYMFQAINARDYPLMMGCFLIITVAVVLGVYVAELTYGRIDPRAGADGGSDAY